MQRREERGVTIAYTRHGAYLRSTAVLAVHSESCHAPYPDSPFLFVSAIMKKETTGGQEEIERQGMEWDFKKTKGKE